MRFVSMQFVVDGCNNTNFKSNVEKNKTKYDAYIYIYINTNTHTHIDTVLRLNQTYS